MLRAWFCYWLTYATTPRLGVKAHFKQLLPLNTVVYEISVKFRQAKKFASHLTKILRREYDFNFTTTIVEIMGRRLLDKVVYRIRLRVEANKSVAAITEAVKVFKKTIYKLRLNLNIWGEPYALPIVTLSRYRSLLPY